MALTFYHGHGSPYAWRVFLALEHLRVPYELKLLSFAAKDTRKPEFLAVNPRGKVPTIVDDGVALWESSAILEYLDETYGLDGPARLYAGTAAERARIRRLIRESEEQLELKGIDVVIDEYLGKGDAAPDAEKASAARAKIAEELAYLERELGKGPYFGVEAPNALDFVVYPMVGYMKRVTFRKPDSALTALLRPPMVAWAERIEKLPYFEKTFPAHWRS